MRKIVLAAALALMATGAASALQPVTSEALRASGRAGEQANGYLGIVGQGDAALRAQVNAINIRRRASYTQVARARRVQIEAVAAAMACALFAEAVLPGQYYRLADGVWRRREGNEPVPRPAYCG